MKHITDAEIHLYYNHAMKQEEERGLLEHIAVCEYCAGRWASSFPKQEMLVPPASLQEEIVQQAGENLPSQKWKESYWEWYRYSARVILAMGLAVAMLFFHDFSSFCYEGKQGKSQVIRQEQGSDGGIRASEQIKKRTESVNRVLRGMSEQIGNTLRGEDQG